MKPYYENEHGKLYCGDCLEILPALIAEGVKVDACVTDPPYGIDGGRGGDSRLYQKGAYVAPFADTQEYIASVCVEAIKWCIANCDAVALTPGARCLHMYPPSDDMGCFWTPASCTHGPWGLTTFTPILYYGHDYRAGKCALPTGRKLTEPAEKNGHPCPKPISAWMWLVDKVAPPHSTVLDPFAGSGTTLVAAQSLGRKWIGIEISPAYCDICVKRLEGTIRQIEGQATIFDALKAQKEKGDER